MGCIWDADARGASSVPIRLRTTRLLAIHLALTEYAVESGMKAPSPLWTSPRLPMLRYARLRWPLLAEGLPVDTPQISHSERPVLCVRQPQYDPPLAKLPTNGTGTKACLAGSHDTESADAASGPA